MFSEISALISASYYVANLAMFLTFTKNSNHNAQNLKHEGQENLRRFIFDLRRKSAEQNLI